jgi:hypothetical protein
MSYAIHKAFSENGPLENETIFKNNFGNNLVNAINSKYENNHLNSTQLNEFTNNMDYIQKLVSF